jgi:type III restriction enzyme
MQPGVQHRNGNAAKLTGGKAKRRGRETGDSVALFALPVGSVRVDSVDLIGIQFGDAIPKLKALARYAETFDNRYRHIEAIAKIGGTFCVLDLEEGAIRSAIATAKATKAL